MLDKNVIAIMTGATNRRFDLAGLLFVMFAVIACAAETANTQPAIPPEINLVSGHDKTYRFSDVRITIQENRLLVSGRVQAPGKTLRGHIDVAIFASSGEEIGRVSVKPTFGSRSGYGTMYSIGFPFQAALSISSDQKLSGATVKLELHRAADFSYEPFDCGTNKAVHQQSPP